MMTPDFDDPIFMAEAALADLEESLCMIHPKQKLPLRISLSIISFLVWKIVYWNSVR